MEKTIDYLNWYGQNQPPARKRLARWLQRVIEQQRLQRAEPDQALWRRDEKLIQRFFHRAKMPAVVGE